MIDKIVELCISISGMPYEILYDRWFNIMAVFERCKGDGYMLTLFAIAVIYLLIKEKNMDRKVLLVIYPIIAAFLIFCPFFFDVLEPFLEDTYYRIFWILPIGIVIAYAFTDLMYTFSKKYVQFPIFIASIVIIAFCGKFIYTENNFSKVYNLYKIPDEAKWVIDIISEDTLKDKFALVPAEITPYVRQINSKIQLTYGRDVTNMYAYGTPALLRAGDMKTLLPYCRQKGVTYIVTYNNVELNEKMYKYGYHVFDQTYSYTVYKYIE